MNGTDALTLTPWTVGEQTVEVWIERHKEPSRLLSVENREDYNAGGGVALVRGAANARLIAAAPDLLEALRDIYSLYTGGFLRGADVSVERAVKDAYAALCKAEGR